MKYPGAWLAAAIAGLMPFGPSPAAAETLAVFTKSAGNPIARAVRAGAEVVAKANGFTVTHYIPTSADNAAQQTALVEEALRTKHDAIVFTPVDVKAMVAPVQKINAAGIPVVNVSDRLAGGNTVAFIGVDDYGIALETARTLLKAMGGKGNVVVLEGPDTIPTAISRGRAFKDALKEFPDVKVVLSKNAMYARPAASDLLKTMLKANPNQQIDGVLAANDAMALGTVEAFKEAKKKNAADRRHQCQQGSGRPDQGRRHAGERRLQRPGRGLPRRRDRDPHLRKQPVPKEVMAKTAVVDKANYQQYETPAERRPCPTLESMAAK